MDNTEQNITKGTEIVKETNDMLQEIVKHEVTAKKKTILISLKTDLYVRWKDYCKENNINQNATIVSFITKLLSEK